MNHTECKDCKLRNGDCGHHFKMNGKGKTNYDIPSLTACDRYGDCMFFQREERPQGELIGREALKEEFNLIASKSATGEWFSIPIKHIKQIIDNATPVEQEVYMHGEDYDFFIRGYKEGRKDFERPKGEWIQAKDEEGIEIYRKILCSRCNKASVERYSFCPNCGADMRKGKNNERL